MTLGEFLWDRLGRIALEGITAAVAAVFLMAAGTQRGVVVILLLALFLVWAAVQLVDFLKCRASLEELQAVFDGLDQKYLFAECAPAPGDLYGRRYFDLMRRSGKAMIGAVSEARAAQREYREYVESWVHEIKAPITAAGLICQNVEPRLRRKLMQELGQIEAHVERALFYARAESPEKDFMVRKTDLRQIVDQAISNHRALLIQSGIRLETEKLSQTVYTDEKWAVFILGQLLQNAARYRRLPLEDSLQPGAGELPEGDEQPEAGELPEGDEQPEAGELPEGDEQPGAGELPEDGRSPVIGLSARKLGQLVQLRVWDNGIGIAEHELSRVFDRGFTGSNGRLRGGSTGMGLYLCRRLAECLEMEVQIESQPGEGTAVTLTFPAVG